MPVYNYSCACGHKEEKLESIHAPMVQDCPECLEQLALERVIVSAPTINFKGGGWYKDSYAK